ncbi:hypothetical protein L2E82_02106 [Cichorium intybus]|uniref:Uncharacterized protein n=1 Tax=Cichorium intybus TaxID=13427 RepID=A0ACB9H1J3_CICIN|nr:hypothetical protein L2E82_02106 [Cichorium intybus]
MAIIIVFPAKPRDAQSKYGYNDDSAPVPVLDVKHNVSIEREEFTHIPSVPNNDVLGTKFGLKILRCRSSSSSSIIVFATHHHHQYLSNLSSPNPQSEETFYFRYLQAFTTYQWPME